MKEIMDILSPVLGEELAKCIVVHRKGKKCPLTTRGAKSLLREYEATGNPIAAAEEHLNRGWQGFKAEWVMKGKNFTDPHNPSPVRETREEYIRKAIEQNNQAWEPSSNSRVSDLIKQAVRH